jgi:hypothetical protein
MRNTLNENQEFTGLNLHKLYRTRSLILFLPPLKALQQTTPLAALPGDLTPLNITVSV